MIRTSGHVTSIIGIVPGAKEYQRTGRSTGLVVSIIGEVCSLTSSVLGVIIVMSQYGNRIQRTPEIA